jgi:hypothetical protein
MKLDHTGRSKQSRFINIYYLFAESAATMPINEPAQWKNYDLYFTERRNA